MTGRLSYIELQRLGENKQIQEGTVRQGMARTVHPLPCLAWEFIKLMTQKHVHFLHISSINCSAAFILLRGACFRA